MNYLENYKVNEEISEFKLIISDDYSDSYSKACNIKNYYSKYVNLTELATLSLKKFLERFPIPEGSIHSSQEVTILKNIKKNNELKCVVILSANKEIKESLFIKIKTNYKLNNEIVASSEGTLIVPKK